MYTPRSLSLLLFAFTLFSAAFAQGDPCIQGSQYRIVVLGSSTAAGAGASPRDSSWVNRYRDYLQSLNPANELINLGVGGFVTYRIMPDAFVPPPNRPLPDTNHNISRALSLQPDGIIINLPSNDRRYPMGEQLANFDSLLRYANRQGVPVWICTTQPIAPLADAAYQVAVKDSIIQRFSPYVLDFWTSLVDTNGTLQPQYAADAVHLNNQGHRLLLLEAIRADLPRQLYQAPPFPDVGLVDMLLPESNSCGDSLAEVELVLNNFGLAFTDSLSLWLSVQSPESTFLYPRILSGGMPACQLDTLRFQADLSSEGRFQLLGYHSFPGDSLSFNDSLFRTRQLLGQPSLALIGDSACMNGSTRLRAIAAPQDTVFWYALAAGGSPIGAGDDFFPPPLSQSQTYYAQAIRGDLVFRNQLLTTSTSNVNWNGVMFDVIAHDTLTLDSLALKVADLGPQPVEGYHRRGGHRGFEQNASAWTFWGSATVQVVDPDSFVVAKLGSMQMMPGDTLGVYLQMANASSRLSYRSNGSTLQVSTPELSIFCGSGSSHNFGGNFYPRQWNGKVFYQHGSRPLGACHNPRLPVEAVLETPPDADLGGDTLACEQALLQSAQPAARYRWSTGDSSRQLLVSESGVYWLELSNACGRDIDAVFVTLDSFPQAGFSYLGAGNAVAFRDQSRRARSYFWNFGDGQSSSQASPTHTYSGPGAYSVYQVVENACGADTSEVQEVGISTTSIEPEVFSQAFSLYPNPAYQQVWLESKGEPLDRSWLSIYDGMGRKMTGWKLKKVTPKRYLLEFQDSLEGIFYFRYKGWNRALIRRRP
jgi:lysophospholipase L1-like esterase